MNLNLNSNTSNNTKAINQESTEQHVVNKHKHKKANSKMFEKIFEAMNPNQKNNIAKKSKHILDKTNIDKSNSEVEVLVKDRREEKLTSTTSSIKEEKQLESISNLDVKSLDNNENYLEQTSLVSVNEITVQNNKFTENEALENLVADSNIAAKSSLGKFKGNNDSLDNLINDIKLAKAESSQMLVGSSYSVADSNWIVTDLKTDKMKLSDWVDAFKTDIQKLNAFKIENQNKVSLTLKNENDLIRVVVEKKENSIVVTAKSTEESKENLLYILAEIQNEMAEKNVEVVVNIEDDAQEENSNRDEQEDREESSEQQGEKNNDRNKRRKQR